MSLPSPSPPAVPANEVLTPAETARVVRTSVRTLLSQPMRDLLRPFTLTPNGRALRYRRADVEQFLADRASA